MTVIELAKKCKCSRAWIYRLIKQYYHRIPTEEEIMSHKGKIGRPAKYKEKKD